LDGTDCSPLHMIPPSVLPADAPTYCPFQFHPYISSRPGRAQTLRAIIQHLKAADGVWLATGSEVAR
jgi:hypothetical protein